MVIDLKMTYNGIGAVNKIEHLENSNLVLEEFFEYNSGTIVRNYRKKNLGTNPFADVAFTTNPLTYSNNEWQWAYRQSALGGREQKRLMTSPHSDETANNGKIFAHLWEYSLLGAGGEELIFYKGFQINTNTAPPSNDAGRRVYMGVHRYMVNGGEIQINGLGVMELHITDHLGNVRVITNQDGSNLKKFDYKPFGELLWSNSPTPRKGFESAECDAENGYISMGARTYCQDIGRFLQPDPLFEAFARHTPYHYSFNSPLVWFDPSGLAPEKEKREERLQMVRLPEYEQGEVVYLRGYMAMRMAWCLAEVEWLLGLWHQQDEWNQAIKDKAARIGGSTGTKNGVSDNKSESKTDSKNKNSSEWVYNGVDYGSKEALVAATSNKTYGKLGEDGYPQYIAKPITVKSTEANNGFDIFWLANNWVSNTFTAANMTIQWILGTSQNGPTVYRNCGVANSMRNAFKVDEARNKFYEKYRGVEKLNGASYTNFRGTFGLEGLFKAGLDPIEQFIGSYRIDIFYIGNFELQFKLYNKTSFNSATYGIGPSWENGPMGNYDQIYIFTEPVNHKKLRK